MNATGHLWAVGFDDTGRAQQLRDEIARLAEQRRLVLLDSALAARYADGSITLDGEPFVAAVHRQGISLAGILAGLALGAPPLTGAAVGAMQRAAGVASSSAAGMDEDFISDVACLMKPGTSALFVLDREGDPEAILQGIRGLGGTVLKTNVDLERAELIQSTLAAVPPPPSREEAAASPF